MHALNVGETALPRPRLHFRANSNSSGRMHSRARLRERSECSLWGFNSAVSPMSGATSAHLPITVVATAGARPTNLVEILPLGAIPLHLPLMHNKLPPGLAGHLPPEWDNDRRSIPELLRTVSAHFCGRCDLLRDHRDPRYSG